MPTISTTPTISLPTTTATTAQQLYNPPGGIKVSERKSDDKQIRLLLLGRPGTGKTYSVCVTFPNVVVANIGNGITPVIRKLVPDLIEVPFWDLDYIKKNIPSLSSIQNVKDAFKSWLASEVSKFSSGQTLLIDDLSALQDYFHQQTEKEIPLTKEKQEENKWFEWREKGKYFRDIHLYLLRAKCHVVSVAHEREIRDDKTGALLSKVAPFFTGQFCDRMGAYYNEIYHSFTEDVKEEKTNKVIGVRYLWQVKSDTKYDLKTRMAETPAIIEQDFRNIRY